MDGQMLVRASGVGGRAARLLLGRQDLAQARHVLHRHHDLQVQDLAGADIHDGDLAVGTDAAEEPGDGVERPLGGGEADALRRRRALGAELLEALEAQRQVRPALRPGDGVDLVHDDVLDPSQDLAGLAGQEQVQALRGRDQDVGRTPGRADAGPPGACRRSGSRR